jgi:ribosomal protein S3
MEGEYMRDFREQMGEILEDIHYKTKKIINEWCNESGIQEPVGYYKNPTTEEWEIYTTRPGFMIGRAGVIVDKYRELLNEEFYCDYNIKFIEIKGGIANTK